MTSGTLLTSTYLNLQHGLRHAGHHLKAKLKRGRAAGITSRHTYHLPRSGVERQALQAGGGEGGGEPERWVGAGILDKRESRVQW